MATATISKDFTFSASHRLAGLDPEHPCSRLHGHNYTVRLTLTGYTNAVGFVIDYRDLSFFKDLLDDLLDHRDLNELFEFNPTAENIAHHLLDFAMGQLDYRFHESLQRLSEVSVSVSETPKTWATATTTRPAEFPSVQADAERRDRHWPGLDPHIADQERYRWNFDHDGSGK